ncbi:uncharacterized protein LOC125534226 [Triticum urartu]|uniref:uncharacterized protein LOC125534226 n=1 Tax=Triticum urartu TaxID=4572 RepID=UPI0020431640|nr:uncharacterized protein LOC125534226 [Triticum urartu]
MNGIISWKELNAKEKLKFGEMKKMVFNFVIVPLLEADTRTVRGMLYYRKALKLQAFLDMASESGATKRRARTHLLKCSNFMSCLADFPVKCTQLSLILPYLYFRCSLLTFYNSFALNFLFLFSYFVLMIADHFSA